MTGQTPETIVIVDDEVSVLKALRRLLEVEGFAVRTFNKVPQFLAAHDPEAPGCILLDVDMPHLSGIAVQRHLLSLPRCQPVVFVSGKSTVPISVEAMKLGAVDFLTKPVDRAALLSAVQQALARDGKTRRSQMDRDECRARHDRLTAREREVFHLVVRGFLNKQIAASLGIAEKTVKIHRARTMHKTGAHTIAELVRFAAGLEM